MPSPRGHRNELGYLLLGLALYQERVDGVVVESTFNGYGLVDGLMEAGYPVHLANTAAIQHYTGLKYTDDRSDARWLAHLLRLKVLLETGDIGRFARVGQFASYGRC